MLTPFQTRAARALAQAPFFGEFEDRIPGCVYRTAIRRGETLFRKGDPSDHLFGLISGRLKVFTTPAADREIALDVVAPGELVGSQGVAYGAPRYAGVKALAHSELATVTRSDLDALLECRPELLEGLGAVSAHEVSRLAERATDAALLNVERRLEKVLTDLADRLGEASANGVRIPLRQRDLAEILGVTRESVNRALTSPSMRPKLALRRGSIVLLSG